MYLKGGGVIQIALNGKSHYPDQVICQCCLEAIITATCDRYGHMVPLFLAIGPLPIKIRSTKDYGVY
jgi:hypothetical protein